MRLLSHPKLLHVVLDRGLANDVRAFTLAGEAVAGPYRWGQYDLLVLPPAFPYGGMENPCLTFVTPSLIVGDRSATRVIAHEISHSWTGNLVTNVRARDRRRVGAASK